MEGNSLSSTRCSRRLAPRAGGTVSEQSHLPVCCCCSLGHADQAGLDCWEICPVNYQRGLVSADASGGKTNAGLSLQSSTAAWTGWKQKRTWTICSSLEKQALSFTGYEVPPGGTSQSSTTHWVNLTKPAFSCLQHSGLQAHLRGKDAVSELTDTIRDSSLPKLFAVQLTCNPDKPPMGNRAGCEQWITGKILVRRKKLLHLQEF